MYMRPYLVMYGFYYGCQTGISHTKKRMITVSIKEETIKNENEETYAAMAIYK